MQILKPHGPIYKSYKPWGTKNSKKYLDSYHVCATSFMQKEKRKKKEAKIVEIFFPCYNKIYNWCCFFPTMKSVKLC